MNIHLSQVTRLSSVTNVTLYHVHRNYMLGSRILYNLHVLQVTYITKTFLPELRQTPAEVWQLVGYMSHGSVTCNHSNGESKI
jgi:hypothetical protein